MTRTMAANDAFVMLTVANDGALLDHDGLAARPRTGSHWYVLSTPEISLVPHFRTLLARAAQERPDVGILYGDAEVLADGAGRRAFLDLKPDFDLTLLISNDYIGLPVAIQADVLHRLGGTDAARVQDASIYDLMLRAVSAGVTIARIPEVLAQRKAPRLPPRESARKAALTSWLGHAGNHFELQPGRVEGSLQLRRRFAGDHPQVTVIVPTRQSAPDGQEDGHPPPFVIGLLETIERLNYPMDRLHVLVGDDIDDDTAYAGRSWPFGFQRVVTARKPGEPFNYAAKMNLLWRMSRTEQIVFMNDDITAESTEWLEALLTFSMQEDVGGAGARLLYPNGTIQHAGIPGGLFGVCAHAWLGLPSSAPTYQDWALVHREWSMVTGAVFATRRSLLETVNGFDERFSLEFNDVDLCLRLRLLGYRIVYTPFAELTHHEKASRGDRLPPASELALFLKRWRGYLVQDPHYHPRLDRESLEIRPLNPRQYR